jgi:transposase
MARNQLDTAERIRLYEWLKIHATQAKVDEQRHSYATLADVAGKALGLKIADSSVKALLETLGVKTKKSTSEPLLERVERLERLLLALYSDLGKPVPE